MSEDQQGQEQEEQKADVPAPEEDKKQDDKKNERQSQRFKVGWPSRVLLPGKRIVSARTKDVSIGGVGFELDEEVAIGTSVNIELSPWVNGQRYVIRAKGAITYNMLKGGDAGFSHGLKFTFIPPDQMEQLKDILKSLE